MSRGKEIMTNKYEKLKYNTILCFDIASTQFTEELQEDINDCCAEILKCFDELAEYKKIGTVEQLEWCKDASHWKELFKEKLEQYEAIGTIEEFKALKKKKPKNTKSNKVVVTSDSYAYCPHCNNPVRLWNTSCEKCGGRLDWH